MGGGFGRWWWLVVVAGGNHVSALARRTCAESKSASARPAAPDNVDEWHRGVAAVVVVVLANAPTPHIGKFE